MDQKNTIVNCMANPDCLFNHNGVCDNYVISIGEDGKCDCYVETATEEDMENGVIGNFSGYSITKPNKPIILKETKRCDLFDDMMDIEDKHLGEAVTVKTKIAELNKPNKNQSIVKPMSDHLCDISCIAATYAEDGELYCSLIQDYPERPFRCSAYDDGGCDCPDWDKNTHGCRLPKCCWS